MEDVKTQKRTYDAAFASSQEESHNQPSQSQSQGSSQEKTDSSQDYMSQSTNSAQENAVPGSGSSQELSQASNTSDQVVKSETNTNDDAVAGPSTIKTEGDESDVKNEGSPSKSDKSAEKQDSKSKEKEAEAKSKKEKMDEERLKMQVLVSNFTEEQLNRYEMFRRAAFPKAAVKRLMQNCSGCGSTVPQNVVIAMSGIAKVYVGEITESALDVMEEWQEKGPIQPKHIREAVRRLKQQGAIPNSKHKKRLFRS